jgi:four helix bundle protein
MVLVVEVYRVSQRWPAEETFGLRSQTRRAAVWIPSNVAESQGRSSEKEFLQFLSVSHGSLREVETQLLIAQRLSFFSDHDGEPLLRQTSEVGRLIQGLMRKLRRAAYN